MVATLSRFCRAALSNVLMVLVWNGNAVKKKLALCRFEPRCPRCVYFLSVLALSSRFDGRVVLMVRAERVANCPQVHSTSRFDSGFNYTHSRCSFSTRSVESF